MTQFNFGLGNIYATPVGGGAPVAFGTISAASVDISGDVKMLYGQNQFPDDVAVGKRKITGKLNFAKIDYNAMNAIYFGQTYAAGQLTEAVAEAHSVPASSPYTVTTTNAATFSADLGVTYASSGLPLTQVASAPTTGQYTVNNSTGVYTFSTGDAGAAILVNYAYSVTGSGATLTVNQSLMGNIQTFQLYLFNNYKGKTFGMKLLSCVADKLSLPFKQDDFTVIEVDFSAYANSAGQVFSAYSG